MALRLSTGMRNKMLGLEATVVAQKIGTDLAFVDGGAGADTITSSASDFITNGFAPGQVLFCKGATTAANDAAITGAIIQSVTAGTITLETGIVDTAEAGAAGTVIAAAQGGSLADVLKDGVLEIYSGSQPASPDDPPNGTKLITITIGSGAFAHGSFDNGLEFDVEASGAISKPSGVVWSGVGLADGTAASFRFKGNPTDNDGSSTTLPRIDGSVGTSGAELNMSSTSIATSATYTIDSFTLTLPMQYGA